MRRNGPGDEPSYAGSIRGQIRGRWLIEVMSPVSVRALIEVTFYGNPPFVLISTKDWYENHNFIRVGSRHLMSPVKGDL